MQTNQKTIFKMLCARLGGWNYTEYADSILFDFLISKGIIGIIGTMKLDDSGIHLLPDTENLGYLLDDCKTTPKSL